MQKLQKSIFKGKSLSGGVYPVSGVLADDEVMSVIKPGQHGSTFGGNPLGSKVVIAAIQVIFDDCLCQNADKMGHKMRSCLKALPDEVVKEVRGQGLFNAIEINPGTLMKILYSNQVYLLKFTTLGFDAWNICLRLMKNGVLTKPTHGSIIRLTPPLCIKEREVNELCQIIRKTICEEVKNK